VPTYVQNSYQVLQEMKDLDKLPRHARLFIANTVSVLLISILNMVFKSFMNGLWI
jgi:hypothetical protein